MKRIFLLLILTSLLFLTGCTNNKENNSDNTSKDAYTLVDGKPSYKRVDVNLASMNGTIAYSQVYDMIINSNNYVDKVVKMKGNFSIFESNLTNQYYPAVIIKDATACCSQGIEFLLYGNPPYPVGYPDKGKEVTVVGIFKIYYEGESKYCHLVDAVVL